MTRRSDNHSFLPRAALAVMNKNVLQDFLEIINNYEKNGTKLPQIFTHPEDYALQKIEYDRLSKEQASSKTI